MLIKNTRPNIFDQKVRFYLENSVKIVQPDQKCNQKQIWPEFGGQIIFTDFSIKRRKSPFCSLLVKSEKLFLTKK